MVLIALLMSFFYSANAEAFVLLSGPVEARLEADADHRQVTFMLSMNAPHISGKAQFMGGAYADLSDEDFWLNLVTLAMEQWNSVPDAYIDLKVEFASEVGIDQEDGILSIVVGKTNLTSSAFAQPKIDAGKILDCDINISERGADAENLAYTIMHELGHCLGLGHNHSDYSAVMGYSRTDRSLKLGLDDEAGLIFLYPEPTLSKPRELASCGSVAGIRTTDTAAAVCLFIPFCLALIPPIRRAVTRLRRNSL